MAIIRSTEIVSTVRFPSASSPDQLLYPRHLAPWSKHITAIHLSVYLPFQSAVSYPAQLYAAQRALPRLTSQLPGLKKVTMTVVEGFCPDKIEISPLLARGPYLAGAQGWSSYRSGRHTDLSTELAKIVLALQGLKLPSAALCFYGDSLLKENKLSGNYELNGEPWKPQMPPTGDRTMPAGADTDAIVAEVMTQEGYDCWI